MYPELSHVVTEVQIAVHSTGICGSDVSYYTKGYIGDFVVKDPKVRNSMQVGPLSNVTLSFQEVIGPTTLRFRQLFRISLQLLCRVAMLLHQLTLSLQVWTSWLIQSLANRSCYGSWCWLLHLLGQRACQNLSSGPLSQCP